MAQRINMVTLMTVILLAIFTLSFGVGVWMMSDKVTQLQDGGENMPQARSLKALRAENEAMRKTIGEKQDLLDRLVEQEGDMRRRVQHTYDTADGVIGMAVAPVAPTIKPVGHASEFERDRLVGLNTVFKEAVDLLTAAIKTGGGARFQPHRDEIARCQAEVAKVLQLIGAEEKQFAADKTRLEEELGRYNALQASEAKRLLADAILRENRILQREDQIRKLLEIELRFVDGVPAAGEILEVAAEIDRVVIDLGSKQRIRLGMLFDVFQYEKGAQVDKGRIEIVDVSENTAVGRLLSIVDPKRKPIARGDKIGNPLYNPLRPRVFALAGDFRYFNTSEYEAFIKATGNEVVREIQPGVDYLIVRGDDKDRSTDARARAREFHIMGMTEDYVVGYLTKSFPVISRRSATAARPR